MLFLIIFKDKFLLFMKTRYIYLLTFFFITGTRSLPAQTVSQLNNLPENWSFFGNQVTPHYDSINNVITLTGKESSTDQDFFGMRSQLLLSDAEHPRIEFEADVRTDTGFFFIESEIKNIAHETEWMTTGNPVNELFQKLNTNGHFRKFSFELNKEYAFAKASGGKSVTISIGIKGTGRFRIGSFTLLSEKGPVTSDDRIVLLKADSAFENTDYYSSSGVDLLPKWVTTEDLFLLGKTWGFLKYHHPAIRGGNFNWDIELFKFLPRYLKSCARPGERNAALYEWIKCLGHYESGQSLQPAVAGNIKAYPDYGWIRRNKLGDTLYKVLMHVRAAQRKSTGYYFTAPPPDTSVYIASNELAYPHLSNPDPGFRLLSVFRYWGYLDYCYAYRYLLEKPDAAFRSFIQTFLACKNAPDYALAVKKAIAFLNSGHTILYDEPDTGPLKMLGFLPEKIGSKIVVTKVSQDTPDIKQGDIIEAVNGVSIDTLIARYRGLLPAPREAIFYREALRSLVFTKDSSTTLSVKRDGKLLTVSIDRYLTDASKANQLLRPVDTVFMELNAHTAFLNLTGIPDDSLEFCRIFEKIRSYKNLVIDLRGYPLLRWDLIRSHFFNQGSAIFAATSVHPQVPGLFRFTESGLEISSGQDSNFYNGHIALLTNAYTQSYAETLVMAFKQRPHTIIVGQTTAGANGNTFAAVFPGGYFTRMESLGVYTLQQQETQRIGLQPDYQVEPTLKDIAEGRDMFIEKAIQLLNSQ